MYTRSGVLLFCIRARNEVAATAITRRMIARCNPVEGYTRAGGVDQLTHNAIIAHSHYPVKGVRTLNFQAFLVCHNANVSISQVQAPRPGLR